MRSTKHQTPHHAIFFSFLSCLPLRPTYLPQNLIRKHPSLCFPLYWHPEHMFFFHTYNEQHRKTYFGAALRPSHTKVKSPQLICGMSISFTTEQKHRTGQLAGRVAVQSSWTWFSPDVGPHLGNCIRFTRIRLYENYAKLCHLAGAQLTSFLLVCLHLFPVTNMGSWS